MAGRLLLQRKYGCFLCCLFAAIFLAACAQTTVRPILRTADKNLPRPGRIVIHDFAVADARVQEYQGILRQQPSNQNAQERQREIARLANETLIVSLAHGLRNLGFVVERGAEAGVREDDISIEGRIVGIDEGSPLQRLLVGFGSGASTMTVRAQVFRSAQRQLLLEFTTRADSGRMPGAAATVPATAALPFTMGLGMTAGSAVASGLNANAASINHMAASSGDQSFRFLAEFFARQGWIGPAQLKGAQLAY